MKRAIGIFFLVLAVGLIGYCAFMSVDACIRASDTVAVAHEAFYEINKIRVEYNLPTLAWDDELERLAIEHSQYMKDTGKLEHSSYPFSYAENILWDTKGFPSGNSVVLPWRLSQGHFMNMISPNISRGAVGIVGDYATFMGR